MTVDTNLVTGVEIGFALGVLMGFAGGLIGIILIERHKDGDE